MSRAMIGRILESEIRKTLGSKKSVIINGARQVGKSTLLHQVFDGVDGVLWYDADNSEVQELFNDRTIPQLKLIFGNARYIVIDEAQRLKNAGLTLKRIHDQIPDVQIFATGSSSFALKDSINEPMTGRKVEMILFPLSFSELAADTDVLTEIGLLQERLVYGCYPEVLTSEEDKKSILRLLSSDYLYRDVLQLEQIKKSSALATLLKAIAFQIGSPVSYHELSQLTGLDSKTVEKYIDVFEQSYVLFRLNSFSRNLRNELKKSRKIYFYDTGVRNAVINNFTPVENRDPSEVGHLWENYVVSEMMKKNEYSRKFSNFYFWRTLQANEIDLIEEVDGSLTAYEIKWDSKAKVSVPKTFSAAYPDVPFTVITPANYFEYLL